MSTPMDLLRCRIAPGADLTQEPESWPWVSITGKVEAPVTVTRGRRNEAARVTPGEASVTVVNDGGEFVPVNPLSPYYGDLDEGTPLWLTATGGPGYLTVPASPASSRAVTPDHASLHLTDGLDVRAHIDPDWARSSFQWIAGRWLTAGNNRAWHLRIAGGVARLGWSEDGSASLGFNSAPLELAGPAVLRCTLGPDDNGGGSLRFWVGYSLDGPFEVVSETLLDDPPVIHPAVAELGVGGYVNFGQPLTGRVHRVQVRDLDGTIVADADFSQVEGGASGFTDSTGKAWSLVGGAAIEDEHDLMTGNISDLPTEWRVYTERKEQAHAPITAVGVLDALEAQFDDDLQSTLRRQVPSRPGVVAYWPMEEPDGATSFASPILGVSPMTFDDPQETVRLSAQEPPGGSLPMPQFGPGSTHRGQVPPMGSGRWRVDWLFHMDEAPPGTRTAITVHTSSTNAARWRVRINASGLNVELANDEGTVVYDGGVSIHPEFYGGVVRFALLIEQGTSLGWTLFAWRPRGSSPMLLHAVADTVSGSRQAGRPTQVGIGNLASTPAARSLAHITVTDGHSDPFAGNADDGHADETAARRVVRLCREEGVPIRVVGRLVSSQRMGPQRPAPLMTLLRDCEDADQGVLGEHGWGLGFTTRMARYNRPVGLQLDAARQLSATLRYQRDRQRSRNDITVTRVEGSWARAVDVAHVARRGPRREDLPVNVASDGVLPHLAHWRLHLGGTDELRWPALPIRVTPSNPGLVAPILGVDLGTRALMAHPLPQLPGVEVDVHVEGLSHRIQAIEWDVDLYTAPARPWDVAVVGRDRYDTAGSLLALPAGASDTELHVVSDGQPWTTDPDDLPLHIALGGEVCQLTEVVGDGQGDPPTIGAGDASESSSTSHVAPSLEATGPARLVCAWTSYAGAGSSSYTAPVGMTPLVTDGEIWADMMSAHQAVGAGATGTRTATYGSDAWSAVSVLVHGLGSAPVVEEVLSGYSESPPETAVPAPPFTLHTDPSTEVGWWLLALYGWDWDEAGAMTQPPSGSGWVPVADSEIESSGTSRTRAWVRPVVEPGVQEVTTPPIHLAVFDVHMHLYVLSGVGDPSAQQFTVVRSVNGVVKPHQAGTQVHLWRRPRFAL